MIENIFKKYSEHQDCPVRHVLDRFGDKWSILILCLLHEKGKLRFNEMGNYIPDMSQKMQTVTLRSLEADGLVSRKMYPEIPPRVEYELTALGQSLVPHIESLAAWAFGNMTDILHSRKKYAANKKPQLANQ
jgi:DNA-binding HxlR family transcriptional regulator